MSEWTIAKDVVVGALVEEWAALDAFLSGLPEEAWWAPTPLPGWSVKDAAGHIIGTEEALLGESVPPAEGDLRALEHVRNDIGALNEQWVAHFRGLSPAEVLELFRSVTARRTTALEAMSQADFDEPSWTPAGHANSGRFMQIRVFDCWMHEQDMRDGAGLPGHEGGPAAELSVDEITLALGYIVGKRAGVGPGSLVRFELTGPVERTLLVEVAERARVVSSSDGEPTTTLRLPSGVFTRLAGGRASYESCAGDVEISGDAAIGLKVASSLAFTI